MELGLRKRLSAALRKTGAVALSVTFVFGCGVPMTAFADESLVAQSAGMLTAQADGAGGTDDNGLKNGLAWSLEGGVLTISGAGAMEFTGTYAPWLSDEGEGGYEPEETKGITKVVIEDGVTSIASQAFWNVTSLKDVSIPDSVTSIGLHAFRGCESLEDVVVPDTVQSMATGVFYQCKNLKDATLPSGLAKIPDSTFAECKALSGFSIPQNVTAIGNSAFSSCTSLSAITLPEALESIGSNTFEKCTALTAIDIPAAVKTVGRSAFQGCTNLSDVTFGGSDTKVDDTAFINTAFLANMGDFAILNRVLLSYRGTEAAEVVIPDTVTRIVASAFGRSDNKHPEITKVTVPAGVGEIGAFAFAYCTGLTEVVMQGGTAPTLGYDAFADAIKANGYSFKVIVPEGSTGYDQGFWAEIADYVGTEAQLAERAAQREQDAGKISDVEAKIKALPAVSAVLATDKDAVEEAKAAYDALSDVGKNLVDAALRTKLAAVYEQLQVILAAIDKEGIAIDEAAFPDAALRNALLGQAVDRDRNGKLDEDELAITQLDLSGAGIANAGGLERFANLATLDLSGNKLASLDVNVFPDLESLDVSGNKLASLDMSKLGLLSSLDVSGNQIKSLNVKALSELTALYAANNKISAIDLSGKFYLADLDLANNKLSALNVSQASSLASLDVSGNALTALDVSKNANLGVLYASSNKLSKLTLGDSARLTTLALDSNNFSALDVSKAPNLQNLSVANNKLNTVNVSRNPELFTFDVSGNPIVALDFSSNPNLYTFTAKNLVAQITYTGSSFDMKTLAQGFTAGKVSNLKGAKVTGTKLGSITASTVTYTYDCGAGQKMSVKLSLDHKLLGQTLSGSKKISKTYGAGAFSLGVSSNAAGARLAYNSSNTKVVTVNDKGKVTIKGAGSATVTVTSTATNYAKATKAVAVNIGLPKAKLTGKTTSAKKGKVTVAWSKAAGATGYQVKVGSKTYTLNSPKTLSKTVAAKAGSKAAVKVRALSKASGKVVYGAWSAVKTVKVKAK